MNLTVFLPLQLRNPLNGNKGGHWGSRARKTKKIRTGAAVVFFSVEGRNFRTHVRARTADELHRNLTVTLTRIAPRFFDDEGWVAACKPLRDGLADQLRVSDGHSGPSWRYAQRKPKPGEAPGVEVTLELRTFAESVAATDLFEASHDGGGA